MAHRAASGGDSVFDSVKYVLFCHGNAGVQKILNIAKKYQ